MKKWTIAIVVILVLTVASLGFLYARLNNGINNLQSQMTGLESEVSSLEAVSPQTVTTTTSATTTITTTTSRTTMTMADLFSLLQPVIVRVDVTGPGFQSSGSGIILTGDGYIITNAHVIEDAVSITITLNTSQQYSANITASDNNLDLAILKLVDSPSDLPAAELGSLTDIGIGVVVVAAGFPLGPDLPGPASYTQGIISAIRTLDGQKYIQSDVDINPGNSGGALVNRTNGKVIGITSAGVVLRGQNINGINLAIPIDIVQTFLQANLP